MQRHGCHRHLRPRMNPATLPRAAFGLAQRVDLLRAPAILTAALLLGLAACTPAGSTLGHYRQVGDFELVERSGRPFQRDQLTNRIWIASFFFASCSTECSSVMLRLAEIQERILPLTNVVLVSFTTDPRSDTPETLQRYAARFQADPNRWLFLTGERKPLLRTIVQDFLMPITSDNQGQADLLSGLVHSDKLALVDRQGTVRAYFDGLKPDTPDRVLAAVHLLLQEPSHAPP